MEKYLPECLDSVLGQSFPDWEVVCVNDSSTDGSAAILAEYVAKDDRSLVMVRIVIRFKSPFIPKASVIAGAAMLILALESALHAGVADQQVRTVIDTRKDPHAIRERSYPVDVDVGELDGRHIYYRIAGFGIVFRDGSATGTDGITVAEGFEAGLSGVFLFTGRQAGQTQADSKEVEVFHGG